VDEAGRFPYQSSATIHATRLESERPLLLRITASVRHLIRGIHPRLLLAPLGIGDHIDHRLTRAAVERAVIPSLSQPCTLAYYEDVPYVLRTLDSSSMPSTVDLQPNIIPVDLATKITAIEAYRSQVPALWPAGDMHESLAAYAATLSGDQYAERLWVPSATDPETAGTP
jgi:LmbE family N-acetylglucosaminyl deacetylase